MTPHPLDAEGRCGLCRNNLSGFDAAFAFGSYDGALRQLIQLFKYGKVTTLSRTLAAMLADALPRERVYDFIVPMPMHWRRRWSRGFNQADLLARRLSRRLNVPVRRAVRRRKATPPQAGLTAAKRRANMSGAFAVIRPDALRDKRVLVIDDVFTTGATAGACARVLKRAGAAHVTILTVARADRRIPDLVVSGPAAGGVATQSLRSVLDAESGQTA